MYWCQPCRRGENPPGCRCPVGAHALHKVIEFTCEREGCGKPDSLMCMVLLKRAEYPAEPGSRYWCEICRAPVTEKLRIATMLERHGVKNAFESETLRAKQEATMDERYGKPNALQVPELYAKQEATMVEVYGEPHALQVASLHAKMEDTMVERYGKPNAMQVPELYEKQQELAKSMQWYTLSDALEMKLQSSHEARGMQALEQLGFEHMEHFRSTSHELAIPGTRFDYSYGEGTSKPTARTYLPDAVISSTGLNIGGSVVGKKGKRTWLEFKATYWHVMYARQNLAKLAAMQAQGEDILYLFYLRVEGSMLKCVAMTAGEAKTALGDVTETTKVPVLEEFLGKWKPTEGGDQTVQPFTRLLQGELHGKSGKELKGRALK